ncbi:cation transporter [Chlorella sorokiniana]|uniref:Cation transporter n=1 Tax=Chlorella sorokiniana TaxID=3076 RepID=A0A2P6TQA3_CHLSO|nr:cation transporter [Chlorella sorokiniana]|eukprot:PRW56207.1 cation transporter [Chlorella sorokiniana]
MSPPNRSSQGLACAALAVVALAAALLAVGVNATAITVYNEEDPVDGLRRWGPFVSGIGCAIYAVVVIAFQAWRAPTGWAAHHSPLGTAMCGIGLFWNAVMLITFVLGFIDNFAVFKDWDAELQAMFIFSCCIGPLVWAAALVLAFYDRAHLRQAGAAHANFMRVSAAPAKFGGDVQLEVDPEGANKQAALV